MVLEPVTPQNYDAVLRLAVTPDQRRFVAPVVRSLADAYVWGGPTLAAREGGAVVGFVLLFPFAHEGRPVVNLVRFMIDAAYQGRGLGRALMAATLDYAARLDPRPTAMKLSVVPDNAVAIRLYESAGFAGEEIEDGERVMWRALETVG